MEVERHAGDPVGARRGDEERLGVAVARRLGGGGGWGEGKSGAEALFGGEDFVEGVLVGGEFVD